MPALVLLLMMAAALITACSASGASEKGPVLAIPTPINGTTQSNSGGSVTIGLKWPAGKSQSLAIEVAMNTHSVNLDEIDLKTLSVLRDDSGQEYSPVSWSAEPGSHHRSGTLTFKPPDSLKQGKAKYVEIVIRGVAGIKERLFRWQFS